VDPVLILKLSRRLFSSIATAFILTKLARAQMATFLLTLAYLSERCFSYCFVAVIFQVRIKDDIRIIRRPLLSQVKMLLIMFYAG